MAELIVMSLGLVLIWAVITWFEKDEDTPPINPAEPLNIAERQAQQGHHMVHFPMVDNQGRNLGQNLPYDPLHERWHQIDAEDGYHPPVRPQPQLTLEQQINTEFYSRIRHTVVGSVILTWKEITET